MDFPTGYKAYLGFRIRWFLGMTRGELFTRHKEGERGILECYEFREIIPEKENDQVVDELVIVHCAGVRPCKCKDQQAQAGILLGKT